MNKIQTSLDSVLRDECAHETLRVSTDVHSLAIPDRKLVNVQVCCAECGQEFEFMGMRDGMSHTGPARSAEGTLARLAIRPKGAV